VALFVAQARGRGHLAGAMGCLPCTPRHATCTPHGPRHVRLRL